MARAIPEWQQVVLSGLQAAADHNYDNAVESFRAAAQDWIAANLVNRDTGLPLTVFSKPIPARAVIGVSEDGMSYTQTEQVDPTLHPPVLPPPTPKAGPVQISTDAGIRDQARDGMLARILLDLAAIKTKLNIG